MTLDRDRLIIRATLRDPETLACPMCPFVLPVPGFHAPPDVLADVLGMGSGDALGRAWAVQEGRRDATPDEVVAWLAAELMRRHLARHTPEDWLAQRFPEETP